jgi:hypothetical protein
MQVGKQKLTTTNEEVNNNEEEEEEKVVSIYRRLCNNELRVASGYDKNGFPTFGGGYDTYGYYVNFFKDSQTLKDVNDR